MAVRGAGEQIDAVVSRWEGVTRFPHRFGGREYRLGDREIGHVHGDGLVDIPFPTKVRNEIIGAGLAEAHHVLPQSGWVSFYIRQPADVEKAVALLRRSFDLAVQQRVRSQRKAS